MLFAKLISVKRITDEEDKARLFVSISSVSVVPMLQSVNELEEYVDPT